MPLLIDHIDAIARQLKRDVLMVDFHCAESDPKKQDTGPLLEPAFPFSQYDWENSPMRRQVLAWLDANSIGWRPCAPIANVDGFGSYGGQVYVDVPFDSNLPAYQALSGYLELPDESMRFPEVTLYVCPLELAMKNAAHDEPGFWDRWAADL